MLQQRQNPVVAPACGLSCLGAHLPAPGTSLPALLGAVPTSSASAFTGQLLPPFPHPQLQTHPQHPQLTACAYLELAGNRIVLKQEPRRSLGDCLSICVSV